jgi:hypothetical protein
MSTPTEDKSQQAMPLEYVNATCKMGQGHACCRYLGANADGFACLKHTGLKDMLDARVAHETMNARGDNCPGYNLN